MLLQRDRSTSEPSTAHQYRPILSNSESSPPPKWEASDLPYLMEYKANIFVIKFHSKYQKYTRGWAVGWGVSASHQERGPNPCGGDRQRPRRCPPSAGGTCRRNASIIGCPKKMTSQKWPRLCRARWQRCQLMRGTFRQLGASDSVFTSSVCNLGHSLGPGIRITGFHRPNLTVALGRQREQRARKRKGGWS